MERTIAPKDSHEYVVKSRGNQAFKVVVEQHGADVVVTALAPDGKQLVKVDNASEEQGTRGSEIAQVRAVAAGDYKIRVVPFERPDAKSGKYVITVTEARDLSATEIADAKAEAEILALEDEWEQAVDKRDTATMRRIMRANAISLSNNASFNQDAAQHLASFDEMKKRDDKLGWSQTHTITDRVIKVFGNTAVSTARALATVKARGQELGQFSGQFIHVWSKDDTGWKMVADHFYSWGRIPRERTPLPALDPQVLSSYAGTYKLIGGPSTATISVEEGTLAIEWSVPGEPSQQPPKAKMTAVTDTTFAVANEEFVFVRNPKGQVTEIILLSDGPAGRAIRIK